MISPIVMLAKELGRLGVPVLELSGGSLQLHIVFDSSVTAVQRTLAYQTIATWKWAVDKTNR